MSSFNFQSIQTLELSANDNPIVDVRDGLLLISATRDQERILITAPLQSVLPKVAATKVKTPKRRKPSPLLGRNLHQGSENGMAKLNDDSVKEIRYLLADKDFVRSHKSISAMYRELAETYKVSAWAIKNIAEGASWKHVTI